MTDIQTVIAYAKRFAKAARQDGWTKDGSELEAAIRGAEAELKEMDVELEIRRVALADKIAKDAEEVDEFNAGYEAFKANMQLDDAEQTYRSIQSEIGIPSYDVFGIGYAWAKFQAERAALRKPE